MAICATDAGLQPARFQESLPVVAGIWAAWVRVPHHAGRSVSRPDRQIPAALMGTDIGGVHDSDFIRCIDIEFPLQMAGRENTCQATALVRLAIANLRPGRLLHESISEPGFAIVFPMFSQIRIDLAVAINLLALDPELLDKCCELLVRHVAC
jgi:hypothetical protein